VTTDALLDRDWPPGPGPVGTLSPKAWFDARAGRTGAIIALLGRRFLSLIFTLFLATVAIFAMMHSVPGGPFTFTQGDMTPAAMQEPVFARPRPRTEALELGQLAVATRNCRMAASRSVRQAATYRGGFH
jgi:hypothetical protein